MIKEISKFAIGVVLSAMFTAPCYAQTASSSVNYGRPHALLSIDRIINKTNQTIVPGAAKFSGSLNPEKSDPAKFAFSIYPATSSSSSASFLLYQNGGKPPAHFRCLLAGDYQPDRSMERLLPIEEVQTLFFEQSRLRLVQLWSGRLQLDGVMGTLSMQNVELGPSASGGLRDFRPPREIFPGGPRSVDLYGVSVSLQLDRKARTERAPQVWRYLSRVVGDVLG
jgi:hypothetical protein